MKRSKIQIIMTLMLLSLAETTAAQRAEDFDWSPTGAKGEVVFSDQPGGEHVLLKYNEDAHEWSLRVAPRA